MAELSGILLSKATTTPGNIQKTISGDLAVLKQGIKAEFIGGPWDGAAVIVPPLPYIWVHAGHLKAIGFLDHHLMLVTIPCLSDVGEFNFEGAEACYQLCKKENKFRYVEVPNDKREKS